MVEGFRVPFGSAASQERSDFHESVKSVQSVVDKVITPEAHASEASMLCVSLCSLREKIRNTLVKQV